MAEERKLIYYADDDVAVRNVVSKIFGRELREFELNQFNNGDSLEKKFVEDIQNGNLPFGILIDNKMPGMTGLEFIQRYSGVVPIVMFASSEVREEAAAFGATGYIDKPFPSVNYFVEEIRKYFS